MIWGRVGKGNVNRGSGRGSGQVVLLLKRVLGVKAVKIAVQQSPEKIVGAMD